MKRTARFDLRPFDVVAVPFPYSDRLAEKRRPALVVSTEALHRGYDLLWLLMITSASNARWACDIEVADLAAAGLPAPSLIRTAKIATVDRDRILRRLGRLAAAEARLVKAKLRENMAIV
jgi:mRNA interferase MazF